MVLGIVLCFFGRIMIKPALFVIGFASSTIGLLLLYFLLFYKDMTHKWLVYGIGLLGALFGIMLGLIFWNLTKMASAVMAAYTGFSIGTIIYRILPELKHPKVAFYGIIGPMSLGLLILALYNTERHLILNSSFFGAFIFMQGLGSFLPNYPASWNPMALIPANGGIFDIDPHFWLYGSVLLALFFCGLVTQYLMLRYLKKNKGKHPYLEKNISFHDSFICSNKSDEFV
jgi:putative effector of murein hydrolase LrgA (UPF0299 family)